MRRDPDRPLPVLPLLAMTLAPSLLAGCAASGQTLDARAPYRVVREAVEGSLPDVGLVRPEPTRFETGWIVEPRSGSFVRPSLTRRHRWIVRLEPGGGFWRIRARAVVEQALDEEPPTWTPVARRAPAALREEELLESIRATLVETAPPPRTRDEESVTGTGISIGSGF